MPSPWRQSENVLMLWSLCLGSSSDLQIPVHAVWMAFRWGIT